ncbi:leucine rich repeat gene family [Mythimna separata entomopoxvirus 'L']|uniref:Leucine rich repeat gene family n=1 Tax=Mythimna separata entomopoxvirus 'L' TaxID=1293572 RepID=A0A916NYC0_9POXV|nr:leucine rich repeat gene family [Mythimna separata entomopoxvirus 'L']CCU56288.1 leucine rich repeat gene family [Mythimna separata entomopoxvirus 'L']
MEITKESILKMIENPYNIIKYSVIKDYIREFGNLIERLEIDTNNYCNLYNFANLKFLKIIDNSKVEKNIVYRRFYQRIYKLYYYMDAISMIIYFYKKLNNLKTLRIFTNSASKTNLSSVIFPKTLNIIQFDNIGKLENYDFIKNLDNLKYLEIDKPCNELLPKKYKKLNINFSIPLNYLDNLEVLKIKNITINEDFIKNLPINLKDLYLVDCEFEGMDFNLEYINKLNVLHMKCMTIFDEITIKLPNNIKEINLTETYTPNYDFLEKLPNLIKLFIDPDDLHICKNLELKNINYTDIEYMNDIYEDCENGSKYFRESNSYRF